MRNLFLALVLANLAFAAWHQWFSATPAASGERASEVPGIMLASEQAKDLGASVAPAPAVPEALAPALGGAPVADAGAVGGSGAGAPEAATTAARAADDVGAHADDVRAGDDDRATAPEADAGAPEATAATAALEGAATGEDAAAREATAAADARPRSERPTLAPVAARACVSVGPFRELSQAAAAAATLRADGFDPVQRAGEGDIWVGYWVYLAASPTLEEAEQALARLRDNGMTDPYVIPNSDSGNLISLGVFTEVARAGSRLSAVRELGYEATVSDRTRRATVYWVDVMLAADQTLDFESLQPPGRIMRLEQRPCDPSAQ